MQFLTEIDQSDYSKIESGKRYYTFEQCKRIAMALHTRMDYLAVRRTSFCTELSFSVFFFKLRFQ